MKIFLIGLPGSGKTTLAKSLAEKLKLPFVDLDWEIEKLERLTINEIFQLKKENYFRQAESALLKKYCASAESFVMATGGGAPCFFDNMNAMNRSGKTIFLDVPTKEIALRLTKSSLAQRPLFANMNGEVLKDKVEFLRSQRISFYKQANFTFSGNEIAMEEIITLLQ